MNLRSIMSIKWIYRAWYYFRQGYATYLTFIFGYFSTLVTVYYLAVRNVPPLLDLFPKFASFALLATAVGAPLSIVIGWVHMKRSRLFSSEQDIAVESNPYQYKLPPGFSKEVFTPVTLVQLRIVRRLAETNGLLTDSERNDLDELEKKLVILVEGGYVGSPKRRLNF
ncbi:MAG: hypothetical protein WCC94_00110 [Candidatus Bathyarchaeia archaeon]